MIIHHRLSIHSSDKQSISNFELLPKMLETHPLVDGRAQASPDAARLPPRSFTSTPRAWREFSALWPRPALRNFQSDRHLPVVNSLNACQHLQLARHLAETPSDKAGPRSPVSRAHLGDSRQTASLWNPVVLT